MKKLLFLPVIVTILLMACNSEKQKTETKAASFNMTPAKAFIDSINKVFSEKINSGDSTWLASMYGPDAEILMEKSNPIKGKDILAMWGDVARSENRNWKFTTTDIQCDENFLIETGSYEISDMNNHLRGRGKYLVIYKKYDGQWKLFRDMGNSSLLTE